MAIIGVYLFDSKVFDVLPSLRPSKRGELEIVDVLNHYASNEDLAYSIAGGFWIDAGTFEALFTATKFIEKKEGKIPPR